MTKQYEEYKVAYEEGKEAYLDGRKTQRHNPYNAIGETFLYEAWQDGYVDAATEDELSYE